jgi:hypothetical protein
VVSIGVLVAIEPAHVCVVYCRQRKLELGDVLFSDLLWGDGLERGTKTRATTTQSVVATCRYVMSPCLLVLFLWTPILLFIRAKVAKIFAGVYFAKSSWLMLRSLAEPYPSVHLSHDGSSVFRKDIIQVVAAVSSSASKGPTLVYLPLQQQNQVPTQSALELQKSLQNRHVGAESAAKAAPRDDKASARSLYHSLSNALSAITSVTFSMIIPHAAHVLRPQRKNEERVTTAHGKTFLLNIDTGVALIVESPTVATVQTVMGDRFGSFLRIVANCAGTPFVFSRWHQFAGRSGTVGEYVTACCHAQVSLADALSSVRMSTLEQLLAFLQDFDNSALTPFFLRNRESAAPSRV